MSKPKASKKGRPVGMELERITVTVLPSTKETIFARARFARMSVGALLDQTFLSVTSAVKS